MLSVNPGRVSRMKHLVDIFVRSPVTAKICGQDKKYIAKPLKMMVYTLLVLVSPFCEFNSIFSLLCMTTDLTGTNSGR